MATESASTNGQRTGQQTTGDGGQAARGGQSAGSQERGTSLASRERGVATPFTRFEQNPFASLWQISREMDRLMDSFFGGGLASDGEPRYGMSSGWTPQIEVRQRDESLLIHVDLPGVKQEDVQIEATEDGIAISGERQQQREENEQGFRRSERMYGSFYRLIPLPDGARVDNAKASMHNGVLEVTVPLERATRRQIKIEGGPPRA
jgi:HSP20 family protein